MKTKILAASVLFIVSLLFADSPAIRDCHGQEHIYGPWYKQTAMFGIPEQPAHKCKICGQFQNMGGRFMQLVQCGTGEGQIPGGQGTLSSKDAAAQASAEVLQDFGTWDNYKSAPAIDGYGSKE